MEKLYMYLADGYTSEWEDMILFANETDAIEYLNKHPKGRIELFVKSVKGEYRPSYFYIRNGVVHSSS
jgi:hypothetical protein